MAKLPYAHDGLPLIGELWRPTGPGNGRAALVLHEADGIGGNVRRHAGLLAECGYVVLAADLHGHDRVLTGEETAPAMARFRGHPPLLRARVRASLDTLGTASGIAAADTIVLGYCFGGHAALELARDGAGVAAVTSFHGLLTTVAPAAPGAIRAPILACTGALDPLVPPEDVAAFQAEMTAAGADWQLIVYGHALHSFTNEAVDGLGDPRMAYDAAADRQSRAAMLAFVDEAFGR